MSRARQRGFTLAEVAVAAGILLVLAGIAIATFSLVRRGGNSTEAETNLLRVRTAQELHFSHKGAFALDATELAAPPEGVDLTVEASTGPNVVSVGTGQIDGTPVLALAAADRSGVCHWMAIYGGTGEATEISQTTGPCQGAHVLTDID